MIEGFFLSYRLSVIAHLANYQTITVKVAFWSIPLAEQKLTPLNL